MQTALFARFTARAGAESKVHDLVAGLTARVRTEPGNLVFDPSTLAGDERSWFVYEVYANDAAFAEHIGADYSAEFNAALAPLIEEPSSQLTWLTLVA